MSQFRRYAFRVELPDDEQEEYETAGEGLTAEQAVTDAYMALPDGAKITKALRGQVPDDLDLSPPTATTEASEESDESDEEDDE